MASFTPPPLLPKTLIVGYANWNQCDEKIVEAVVDGVNVVIWFSINLLADEETGKPRVQGGPDPDCVATMIKRIRDLDLECIHLMSIGGWNSPHPDTENSPEDVFAALNYWNRVTIARPETGFFGFDGFDWDIEGTDEVENPRNTFTKACLDTMGRISQLAKQNGYLFALAPAESYLDPTTSAFDRNLTHTYAEWDSIVPNFTYHGHNPYAYLLARYGKTPVIAEAGKAMTVTEREEGAAVKTVEAAEAAVETFDFVTIQLYEGYSHAEYSHSILHESAGEHLRTLIASFAAGWWVDFSSDDEVGEEFSSCLIKLDTPRLVIGLANGWAGDGKFLLLYPNEVHEAHRKLLEANLAPRGYAFWNILDEGKSSVRRPEEPVYMAKGLNSFLHIR